MAETLAILYASMQLIAIIMSWPQIRKLYIAKQSSELSLTTWSTWLLSSFVTMSYAYSTQQFLWVAANVAWASFYTVMVTLIIRYRRETIHEQVLELFRMRFYFAIERKRPAIHPLKRLFARFRRSDEPTTTE